MFTSNDRTSFRLYRKENIGNHQKDSKYYVNDCRSNVSAQLARANSNENFLKEIRHSF